MSEPDRICPVCGKHLILVDDVGPNMELLISECPNGCVEQFERYILSIWDREFIDSLCTQKTADGKE